MLKKITGILAIVIVLSGCMKVEEEKKVPVGETQTQGNGGIPDETDRYGYRSHAEGKR